MMPIKKFHRVEDIPLSKPVAAGERWRRIDALWSLTSRLYRRRFPPGLHKNRTIEEANRRRFTW